jgi:hypothetical protein
MEAIGHWLVAIVGKSKGLTIGFISIQEKEHAMESCLDPVALFD